MSTSREYKENKGICIHKGFRSKYNVMQGHSMVSGVGETFLLSTLQSHNFCC